jgi:hypothetical protein
VSESIESLLEFLRISSRVAVVELEPKRARAFAEVLQLAMEFKEAALARTEQDVAFEASSEREACASLAAEYGWVPNGQGFQRAGLVEATAKGIAAAIRARGSR